MSNRPWLASYRDIPAEIDVDQFSSVVAMTDDAIKRFADHPAFRSGQLILTYQDVDRQSRSFSAFLQCTLKVAKGERVAVMLPNVLAFPVACLGVARTGAIQVNVNPMYTARELRHQLQDSGASIIVVFAGVLSVLAEIIDATSIRQVIVVTSDGIGAAPSAAPRWPAPLAGALLFSDVLAAGAMQSFVPVELCGDDLLFLQYTGGTTGLSKGAALSHRNLVANVAQAKAVMQGALWPGEEVIVTALPLYHVFALMANFLTYFSVGAENWLVANPRDIDGLIDTLAESRLTVFSGVNTLYAALAAHPRIATVDFSRLHLSSGGGASIIESVSDRWLRLTGTFIREGYGLSETSPIVSFNPLHEDRFTGTTGLPVPSTDVKLVDDSDDEVTIGEPGEICVKGPQVMRGYWGRPPSEAGTFTADGYFRTGDIGRFDHQGFLKVVDRKKDMILVSGFNVFPNEVESIVSSFEGVAECACVGVPDESTGEAVRLFVVLHAGANIDAANIQALCRQSMTAYKVPKAVRVVDALPKSAVGKILRRELRDADRD